MSLCDDIGKKNICNLASAREIQAQCLFQTNSGCPAILMASQYLALAWHVINTE